MSTDLTYTESAGAPVDPGYDVQRVELQTLYVHGVIIVLVVLTVTILVGLERVQGNDAIVILSTALGFSGARASQVSGRRGSGNNNG